MKRQTKQLIYTVGVAAFLLSSVNAFAQAKDTTDRAEMKEKWKAKRAQMHKELGLTEDQQQRLQEHRKKHRGGMKSVHKQIKAKKQAMQEELQKDDFDKAKVRTLHSEVKALKDQAADSRLEGILGVREILTPEQFSKFKQMKKKNGFRRNGHKGFKHHEGKWSYGFHDAMGFTE